VIGIDRVSCTQAPSLAAYLTDQRKNRYQGHLPGLRSAYATPLRIWPLPKYSESDEPSKNPCQKNFVPGVMQGGETPYHLRVSLFFDP
jgi:hypothetical protein